MEIQIVMKQYKCYSLFSSLPLSLFLYATRTFVSRVVALPRRERNVSRWDTNTGTRQDTDTDTENRLLRPSANVCAATNLDVARAQRRTERF